MLETLFGKLLVPMPVRLKHDLTAKVCDHSHILVAFVGPGGSWTPGSVPPHIDLTMKLWVPEARTTVHEMAAEAAGQVLGGSFQEMTLEPGGAPVTQRIELDAPEGEALRAKPGDNVRLTLCLTRGRTRTFRVPIASHRQPMSDSEPSTRIAHARLSGQSGSAPRRP